MSKTVLVKSVDSKKFQVKPEVQLYWIVRLGLVPEALSTQICRKLILGSSKLVQLASST